MANLKDVAKRAGVSTATVSRVINGDSRVQMDTQHKVQKAIKELNYRPSRVAQRLRSKGKESKLIGLVLPDIENPFYVDMVKGIELAAYNKGYSVIIGNFSQNKARSEMYIDILKAEGVNGFIVAPVNNDDQKVTELVKSGYQVTCVDRDIAGVEVDVVKVNNEEAAYGAIKHLIDLGHRRIGHVGGQWDIPTTKARLAGYKRALLESGIPVEEDLIITRSSDFQSGVESTNTFLDMEHPPTALFTGNNLLTLGALRAIHARELHIPKDIAIVGFDDMYWSESLNPPLTAVHQDGFEIGRRATELLLNRMVEPDRPCIKVIMDAKLKIRKSCGTESPSAANDQS
ncbi:LacI family DNA-binding transcriptional regulator [Flavilitoribacter nigricans]|uniref:LacI family transcriptional regulator n=1 Tax=Flavilitoribacter nigricans (strain ATCC 23147 / DSM 23189 / NBRC 102662 / NCIMB 1420 / SS-2) TaxID=1122177 RepID=A0A2D0N1P4_FLAN2|nr:LacI family DNA-binding transcriptional regulator [Flavilitoribacter nigricans]PHN02451.1 LacI family transcriptional regulator [Flavilitoribacter nigricans DSM 23189 = NBRC 102662]